MVMRALNVEAKFELVGLERLRSALIDAGT
jgi:hypothetical protein